MCGVLSNGSRTWERPSVSSLHTTRSTNTLFQITYVAPIKDGRWNLPHLHQVKGENNDETPAPDAPIKAVCGTQSSRFHHAFRVSWSLSIAMTIPEVRRRTSVRVKRYSYLSTGMSYYLYGTAECPPSHFALQNIKAVLFHLKLVISAAMNSLLYYSETSAGKSYSLK